MTGETLLGIVYAAVLLLMMAVDLGVFNRRAHEIRIQEALIWTIVWTVVALLFNVAVFLELGAERGLEFFTAYVIERALSFDNLFVFVLIFTYFGVPTQYHHRVLFWGVLGALVTRSIFILAGIALIVRFSWILYILGAILIYSGWKMLKGESIEVHPDRNLVIRLARRVFPVVSEYGSGQFVVRKNGILFLTPILLVLLTIETTDVVFAVDSVPAVFGVTRDAFIAFSSNIFAILGLRASYFLLEAFLREFKYLNHGLSAVLILIGLEMLAGDFVRVPIGVSLAVVMTILIVAVLASVVVERRDRSVKEPSQRDSS